MSRLISFDFDNTLHVYDGTWGGVADINGSAVPGAIEALRAYKAAGFSIAIYSARSRSEVGRGAMVMWLCDQGISYSQIEKADIRNPPEGWHLRNKQSKIRFPWTKPRAFVYFDDRNYPPWDGTFPTVAELEKFQAWWEKGRTR